MDWSRAKNVLILSFLLLNLLLGYQLWKDIQERLNANIDLTELKPETLAVMKHKNIEITEGIPTETPELKDLTYRLLPSSSEPIQLKVPVDSKVIFSADELYRALGDVIPDLDQYVFDPSANSESDGVFVLNRLIGVHPLFDVKLRLYYSNQKIVSYSQEQMDLVSFEDAGPQTVLPASNAVGILIERYLPEGSVIKEIQLGYHGQAFNSETQVAAPSWRVLLEDSKVVYYVQAISGDVVTSDEADTADKTINP